jgi:mannose-1-phosphate guanylyltransferase
MSDSAQGSNKNLPVFAVVMAGGKGRRLWPLSREAFPKQFLTLQLGQGSLLQQAVRRAAEIVGGRQNVLVVSQAQHADLVAQQLPDLPQQNVLLEPLGRNTAACIGLAALEIRKRAPEAVMAVFPADHLFRDERPWMRAVRAAIGTAGQTGRLVAIGIPPSQASTSYGYLRLGVELGEQEGLEVYEVQEYAEKPDAARAARYVESGEYLWNTGTFAWRVTALQEALEEHLPELTSGLEQIAADPSRLEQVYSLLPDISIDTGVMEKASQVAVVRGEFTRLDVGSLARLAELWSQDAHGNAVMGALLENDSQGNLVYCDEGLVCLIGVQDLVVVRQGEVLLVCPKERAQEVKQVVAGLDEAGMSRFK